MVHLSLCFEECLALQQQVTWSSFTLQCVSTFPVAMYTASTPLLIRPVTTVLVSVTQLISHHTPPITTAVCVTLMARTSVFTELILLQTSVATLVRMRFEGTGVIDSPGDTMYVIFFYGFS